jgi:hypothetical protein
VTSGTDGRGCRHLGCADLALIGYQDFSWLLAPLDTATNVIAWLVRC